MVTNLNSARFIANLSLCFVALLVPNYVTASGDHELPLGNGKVSTAPKVGYVYSCQTSFNGGGAFRVGEWVKQDTWQPSGKPRVDGFVIWPNALINITFDGDQRKVQSNNLPTHPTGIFPLSSQDDAYAYDRNPNAVSEQNILLRLPRVPEFANNPSCVSMGMIGFALSGVAIFNALDAMGRDAPAHEIQDACGGHPERSGQYHYHDYSACINESNEKDGHSKLVGYALDGFGIYGLQGAGSDAMTNQDLDACHGHNHEINWDGVATNLFHYHMTAEYPYTIGCFRGEVKNSGQINTQAGGLNNSAGNAENLNKAALELGVSVEALKSALGAPPPNFNKAAKQLGLSANQLRRVMLKYRPK